MTDKMNNLKYRVRPYGCSGVRAEIYYLRSMQEINVKFKTFNLKIIDGIIFDFFSDGSTQQDKISNLYKKAKRWATREIEMIKDANGEQV